jgi:hypothetical protein
MAQKIKVQDGIVVFETADPQYDVDFGISGSLNVETSAQIGTELQVGNNSLAAGTITTAPGQNLTLTTGTGGNLSLAPTGNLLINNVQWPTATSTSAGTYLGASDSNTLQYFPFILAFTGIDTLTVSQLNSTYPSIQSGQSVIGPTVQYLCVTSPTPGPGKWTISQPNLGYTPVNKAGDTMTGFLILSGDPVNSLGAVTKQYVDQIATSINIHDAVQTSTTTTANLGATFYYPGVSGGTFDPGGQGVGALLKSQTNLYLDNINAGAGVGGCNVLQIGSRVLVNNQANNTENGVYVVNDLGANDPGGRPWALIRASDYNNSQADQVHAGDVVYIQEGTLAGTQWVQTTNGSGPGLATVIGTNPITFTQFSGAGSITAGSGINITGNQISNTGVLSNIAGAGISVSNTTGNVTIANTGVTSLTGSGNLTVSQSVGDIIISVSGSVPSSTNVSGGLPGNILYQSAVDTTSFLTTGTSNQVLVSGVTPAWTNTPTLTATNFSGLATNLTAGVANTIAVSQSSSNINYPLVLTTQNVSGIQTLTVDSSNDITWNPSTNSLTLAGSITASGSISAASISVTNNISSSGFNIRSITTGISATGTTLATAYVLTTDINIVTVVGNNTGVALPVSIPGMTIIVYNATGTTLNVYPDVIAGHIDTLSAGTPFELGSDARIMFICSASSYWHTLNATYF